MLDGRKLKQRLRHADETDVPCCGVISLCSHTCA
jgi:hypothetical protein